REERFCVQAVRSWIDFEPQPVGQRQTPRDLPGVLREERPIREAKFLFDILHNDSAARFAANELWQRCTRARTNWAAAARRTRVAWCPANRSAYRGVEPRREIVRRVPHGRVRYTEIDAKLECMRSLHQSERIHDVELALPVIGRCRPDIQIGNPEP